ncbi:MAG: SPOR domain-containing protein [Methylococcaceae bacterium]|nr:SPOR domain-containing protein [Methylococcaceae bacterium]MDP2393494.1 SPOR domain-containing protein [Methylococcaceae bacterium]MDP3021364.1 SPOR domain-containing protein [Methylococcaceae bacterium]MDP3931837.1 SPOR domain-containing protein [Methylococcaceae bacterium]MDZ4155234.1 SPOR domain-containing protein [Methylococcales bacterium]
MKALFFLIITANVGLFMWEYHQGAFEPVIEVALVNKEYMLLLSEVEKNLPLSEELAKKESLDDANGIAHDLNIPLEQAKLPEPNTEQQVVLEQEKQNSIEIKPSTEVICYEAGPFDAKAYKTWRSFLNDTTANIKMFDRDVPVISSYMVYYPAEKSLEQAEAVLKMLKDHGIKDLLLQRGGQDQGEISLGIFSSRERALVLKDQLQIKGIFVEIKPRYKTAARKYINVIGHATMLERLQNIQKIDPEFTIKPLESCP